MRKLILLAALAATAASGTAIAQQSNWRHDRQDRRDITGILARHAPGSPRHAPAWRLCRALSPLEYPPVTVGYRLQPAFYGSRYYISDYGSYNLRAPGRWQRWVRYGDDLLLVNVRTGRVLQVIHYRSW